MGYTVGRRLTFEVLERIAKKYRCISEFQKADPSAYTTSRRLGIFENITRHMQRMGFSIPQLICRQILDALLKKSSLYNSRKVIYPLEVDIYYPSLSLAVEYNGKGWHDNEAVRTRDELKIKLLKDKGVYVVVIEEKSRDYEEDIKNQLLHNTEFLDKFNLSKDAISKYKVNWDSIYRQTTLESKILDVKIKANACSSLKEFRTIFSAEYSFLVRTKLLFLIKHLKKSKTITNDEELFNLAIAFGSYSEFSKSKWYSSCHRRGLLGEIRKKLNSRNQWCHISDKEIIEKVQQSGHKFPSDLKAHNSTLYNEVKKRKLKIWERRKRKNDPMKIKLEFENLINSGYTSGRIKKEKRSLYLSYFFNKRKGSYEKENKQDNTKCGRK